MSAVTLEACTHSHYIYPSLYLSVNPSISDSSIPGSVTALSMRKEKKQMTRTPEMCVEASLAQQARHGWECQTPSRSVSSPALIQSTIFRIMKQRKNVLELGRRNSRVCLDV